MNKYRTSIVTKIDDQLINQWKQLWKRAENASAFNSYEWFTSCLEVKQDKEYELYLCYKNDILVGILPLESYRQFGIKVLGTIFKEHHIDTPFLVESYDKELFKHFFGFVFTGENIFLQKVDNKSTLILKKLFPDLFFSLMSVNPVVDLTQDPFAATHHSTVKQMKKILRTNPDTFRLAVYHDDLEKHIKEIFKLEEKSSKKTRSMDIFSHKENRDFYLTVIKNCKDMVRICFLYFNDLPVAYQYGYVFGNRFVGDQIAYRNEYSKLRPGKLIIYLLLNFLKEENFTMFDLGGGISTYKTEFTDKYRLLYNVYYSNNPIIVFWWKLINTIRRKKQILFPMKNTRDHEFLFRTNLEEEK